MTDKQNTDSGSNQNEGRSLVQYGVASLIVLALVFGIWSAIVLATSFDQTAINSDSYAVSIASALGAIGTLVLAFFTYRSVSSNKELLNKYDAQLEEMREDRRLTEDLLQEQRNQNEEMRKDRELRQLRYQSPLANGAIDQILAPSIDALTSNRERLESGDIGWDPTAGSHPIKIKPVAILSEVEGEYTRFFKENTEIDLDEYEQYNEEIDKFKSSIISVAQRLRIIVRKEYPSGSFAFMEKVFDEDTNQDEATNIIVQSILNREEGYSEEMPDLTPAWELDRTQNKRGRLRENVFPQLKEIRDDYNDAIERMKEVTGSLYVGLENEHERLRSKYPSVNEDQY